MTTDLAKNEEKKELVKQEQVTLPAEVEKVLINGDLRALTPKQRVDFYNSVCKSLGLNPLTKPFDYIELDKQLKLYATKNAAEQLRRIYGVSIDSVDISRERDTIRVIVKGHDKTGRSDVEIGVVSLIDKHGTRLVGDRLVNAEMKALTKAKRRLTLSLCGLGMLDESELETVPTAKKVEVTIEGEIIEKEEEEKETKPLIAPLIRPICPACGSEMLVKCSASGHLFFGCSNYPDCEETREIIEKAKAGETTAAVQQAIWKMAIEINHNDKQKAVEFLKKSLSLPSLKKTKGAKLGQAYEKILVLYEDYINRQTDIPNDEDIPDEYV